MKANQYFCTDKFTEMKKFLVGLFVIATIQFNYAQEINWMSWEQAVEASTDVKKKFVVDVYTEWCGWCKKMDASTFRDDEIVSYINENYYAIKFDAEQKEDITLNGKVYKFNRTGKRGYHQLAAEITRGRLSYPTVVFLDEDLNLIQSIPGYRDIKSFQMIMKYFAEDFHTSVPWKQYSRNYNVLTGGG
jgi:thioredoxin-related protein